MTLYNIFILLPSFFVVAIIGHMIYDYFQIKANIWIDHSLESFIEGGLLALVIGWVLAWVKPELGIINWLLRFFSLGFLYTTMKFIIFPEGLNLLRDKKFGYVGAKQGDESQSWIDSVTQYISVYAMVLIKLCLLLLSILTNIYCIIWFRPIMLWIIKNGQAVIEGIIKVFQSFFS